MKRVQDSPARVKLTGTVLRFFHAKKNPTNGKTFYIFTFQPDYSSAKVVKAEAVQIPKGRKGGVTQYGIRVKFDSALALYRGQRLTLHGFFQKDVKYGWQFKALSAESDTVKSKDKALLECLDKVKASNGTPLIGKDRLKKLKRHFGADLINILEKTPALLCKAVPALSEADALRLSEAWNETRAANPEEAIAKLRKLPEIGPVLAQAILDEFGKNALATAQRNPYALVRRVPGIGFQTADNIALHLNLGPMVRARGWIEHFVRSAADDQGDCGIPKAVVLAEAVKATGLSDLAIKDILDSLLTGKSAEFLEEDGIIWIENLLAAEQKIARWIRKTLQKPKVSCPDISRATNLSEEQSNALAAILTAPVSILTGGPGTGKTTVLREVAARADCILCAPTGRAAKRLSEITGQEAITLHRLVLKKNNAISADRLLVVDECSMADLLVMAALADCCSKRLPRLLFVGDADQLPSVGAGQVFRDLIASGQIPVHRLTKNYRSAGSGGGIVTAAAAVLRGTQPSPTRFSPNGDFCFIETETAKEAAQRAVEFATEILPKQCGLDPLADIQVLTPMRSGPAGVDSLNAALRARLNPAAASSSCRFAPGDRIINLQNNPERGIFNGDLGIVESFDPVKDEATVKFHDATLLCEAQLLRHMDLAYALTAHKSQGSEYPAVVIVLAKGHFVLLNRNLLYTAMTRAQRHLILVAQKGATYLAVKDAPRPRLTKLAALIRDAVTQ